MNADAHFDKARRLAAAQTKLDPTTDWESIVEGCYMSAHNFVLAGVEWSGASHSQSHMHKFNARLLNQVGAPQPVRQAWDNLETLRAGNVYGARTNGTVSAEARDHLKVIEVWATGLHP